jgi:S1-C subfamily serine protease
VRVTLPDGAEGRATVVGRDPSTDLVALRLADGAAATPAARAAGELAIGQLVLAVGRPGDAATAAFGVVSALGPEWRTWQGGRIDRFVRLDLAIYDGFSGGALVDAEGQVLGVNTSGLARSAAVTVPAATVDRVLDQLLAGGRVRRGYLGLGLQPVRLTPSVRQRLGEAGTDAPETALMIVALEPDGPADRGGLLLGDVMVALDGVTTRVHDDVLARLGAERVGQTLDARIVRAGAPITVQLTVGDHPSGER